MTLLTQCLNSFLNLNCISASRNVDACMFFLTLWFKWYRGDDDEREYLVKWKELPYDECYWEFESDISAFQPEIERFNRFRSRSSKFSSSKHKQSVKDDTELKKQQKEFQHYEHSPEFLSGGMLF